MNGCQIVRFGVGEMSIGVPLDQVNQIIKTQDVHKLPQVPEYIEGLINLRGQIITVFNLRKMFNVPDKENDENTKILVVNYEKYLAGFVVDSVEEIVTIQSDDIESVPKHVTTGINPEFFLGIGKLNGHVVLLVDLCKVMTKEDQGVVLSANKE